MKDAPHDPEKAKQLLKEAGYPNGFDAGECSTDMASATLVEAVVNDLTAVGIRMRMRPMERAAAHGAHEVHGDILAEFAKQAGVNGILKYPTDDTRSSSPSRAT